MDAVGFEPTIIGTYACGLEYLTHISMNYTEPDQRTRKSNLPFVRLKKYYYIVNPYFLIFSNIY